MVKSCTSMKTLSNFITEKVKYFNKKDVPNMFSQFLNVRIIIYYINNIYFLIGKLIW